MLREWHTPQVTSFYEEVEAEGYSSDERETIPELPRLKNTDQELTISNNLQVNQREEMNRLLQEYSDVIQDKPGRTDKAVHHIETGNAVPIRQAPYRIPFAQREKMRRELRKMEEMGVIQPSKSDFWKQ